MSPYQEKKAYLHSYKKTIERAKVLRDDHMQVIEFCKAKPQPHPDHVKWKINKFNRLVKLCQDKINFYEELVYNLNI